jgi:hypothetical protein
MNNSSVQESYSITSNSSSDTVTLTNSTVLTNSTGSSTLYTSGINGFGSNTIAIPSVGSVYTVGGSANTVTFGGSSGSGSASSYIWKNPEEFVDTFPDYNRIQKMCEEYPGLKLAYEKFVTTYKLVKEHYDTPEDQRPRP